METYDEERPSQTLSIGLAAVLGLLGLATGFGAAKLMQPGKPAPAKTQQTSPAPAAADSKAANLRVGLNTLGREHVDLVMQAARSAYDGRPDAAAVAALLDTNSKEQAASVSLVYGEQAGRKFYSFWHPRAALFAEYARAMKRGDRPAMDKAVTGLTSNADSVAGFLSQANPNLQKAEIKRLLSDDVTLLRGAIDAYGARNYPQSYSREREAGVQIGAYADKVSSALVNHHPEKF